MKTLFAGAALAALLAGCAPPLPMDGFPDDVTREDRATFAPPARPVAASAVLGSFGGGAAEPAFPGATRPVIVRRLPEGDTWRVWAADNVTGACCVSLTIEQYSDRYRGR